MDELLHFQGQLLGQDGSMIGPWLWFEIACRLKRQSIEALARTLSIGGSKSREYCTSILLYLAQQVPSSLPTSMGRNLPVFDQLDLACKLMLQECLALLGMHILAMPHEGDRRENFCVAHQNLLK